MRYSLCHPGFQPVTGAARERFPSRTNRATLPPRRRAAAGALGIASTDATRDFCPRTNSVQIASTFHAAASTRRCTASMRRDPASTRSDAASTRRGVPVKIGPATGPAAVCAPPGRDAGFLPPFCSVFVRSNGTFDARPLSQNSCIGGGYVFSTLHRRGHARVCSVWR